MANKTKTQKVTYFGRRCEVKTIFAAGTHGEREIRNRWIDSADERNGGLRRWHPDQHDRHGQSSQGHIPYPSQASRYRGVLMAKEKPQPGNGPYHWGNGPKPKSKLAILLAKLTKRKGA